MENRHTGMGLTHLVCVFLLLAGLTAALRADTTNIPFASPSDAASAELLRAYLQVEAQLQATQLALDRNRQEAETAATRNAGLLDTRLRLLEQALVGERARELDSLERSQRLMLIFAGLFAGLGLLAVLLTLYAQWRSTERLAGLGAASPTWALAQVAPFNSLPPGAGQPGPLATMEMANARLLGVVERLEKRIQELERSTRPVAATLSAAAVFASKSELSAPEAAAKAEAAQTAMQIELLLGKGQTLLDLDRAEEALACFDEALKLEPQHAEALLKKGAALEQARKPDEAIACYDRVIATHQTFTMAYLQKGGLCNRLERHEEALKCYEEALKTQAHADRAG